jgi:energy-coupling factor transport system permease protein
MIVHPVAWLAWLAALVALLSSTRNPLHLILILACVLTVSAAYPSRDRAHLAFDPTRLIVLLMLIAGLLNALSVRVGTTVLILIPTTIPLLGGPITLEALLYGALTGLTLAGMILGFGVAQRALPVSALVGLIPRAFTPLAVVSAIAITFVPTTVRHAQQIREAQQIRGHRMRRARDWLPIFMPLLIGGLERSIQLAEALAARGFGRQYPTAQYNRIRWFVVGGLALILGGWLLLLAWGQVWLGWLIMLAGSAAVAFSIWSVDRQVPRTRYRIHPWQGRDSAVTIGAAVVIAALLFPWPGIDRMILAYYPYPTLRLPGFDPAFGFATLGLLWPALALAAEPRR